MKTNQKKRKREETTQARAPGRNNSKTLSSNQIPQAPTLQGHSFAATHSCHLLLPPDAEG